MIAHRQSLAGRLKFPTLPLFQGACFKIFLFQSLLAFVSCETQTSQDSVNNAPKESTQYNAAELEFFLDSVSKLSNDSIGRLVTHRVDSIFNSVKTYHIIIPPKNFKAFADSLHNGALTREMALSIFKDAIDDSTVLQQDLIPVYVHSFNNEDRFDEYAVSFHDPYLAWDNELFFFKRNTLIAKQTIHHRSGLELSHYKDEKGRTVIFYKENLEHGTGIWWYNYFFYVYEKDKIVPLLNELKEINFDPMWGMHGMGFNSEVIGTNPLTIKMKYFQFITDSATSVQKGVTVVDDSTMVTYKYNEPAKMLEIDKNKISKHEIHTYYLSGINDIYFINTFHSTIEKHLHNPVTKPHVLHYLNRVKNQLNNRY